MRIDSSRAKNEDVSWPASEQEQKARPPADRPPRPHGPERRRVKPLSTARCLEAGALGAVTVILSLCRYDRLPDRIPVHFDLSMRPDGWADKSIGRLLVLPLLALAFTFLTAFFGARAERRRRRRLTPVQNATDACGASDVSRRVRTSVSFLNFSYVLLFLSFQLISIEIIPPGLAAFAVLAACLLVAAAAVVLTVAVVRTRTGRSR